MKVVISKFLFNNKQNSTWLLVDMAFLITCSTSYLTRSLRSLVRYHVEHSKRNFISTRTHISSSPLSAFLMEN